MSMDVETTTETTFVDRGHIVITPGICGGRPRIAGTRIRVVDIGLLHEYQKLRDVEIMDRYPDITLSQIHAALTYYFDHIIEIKERHAADKSYAEEYFRNRPLTPLQEKFRQGRSNA